MTMRGSDWNEDYNGLAGTMTGKLNRRFGCGFCTHHQLGLMEVYCWTGIGVTVFGGCAN